MKPFVSLRAIDRKALRDLWHLRGQVLAIAAVIASGVAVLVMSLSTRDALVQSADAYYERYAFGDVFAGLERAPESVALRIAAIDGVQTVQTRVVRFATLDVEGFAEPVIGQLVSIPERGEPVLNRLVLRVGRSVEPGGRDEVVLHERFALAHGLEVGDRLSATLNGHRRRLRIVGIALSPEFVYALGPGAIMPDDRRFGVLWMGREELEAAYDLEGAFNDVSLRLTRGARTESVISQLDDELGRWGGVGAIPRAEQLSNWFVTNEIDQQGTMAVILPTIFLLVSAFLTNMVLARLISIERTEIGLLKAFGYSHVEVGLHYSKLVLAIAAVGVVLGLAAGAWVGRMQTEMYAESFSFPLLIYRPSARAFLVAAALTVAAALLGALGVVRRAALLPPAQAMLPPSPPAYRSSALAQTRLGSWLDQPSRIIARHIAREPLRSALTCVGLACSVALLVLALQWGDALDSIARSFFYDAQRQNVMVGLAEAQASDVVHELEHMPGVLASEASRAVSVDFRNGVAHHRGTLTGVRHDARLQPIYDDERRREVDLPGEGLVLSTRLAQKLGVGVGDRVWVEVLEGRRPEARLPVRELFETHLGMPAYIHRDALDRLLQERPKVQLVSLLVDPVHEAELYRELKSLPQIAAVLLRQAAIDSFYETVVGHLMVMITTFAVFACALGFGVAYNATRIALSERARELATLRVLGFTRGEISYILLGEVGLLIVLGLPIGCVLGRALAAGLASAFDTELYRIPLVVEPSTYGFAVLIALGATLLSAALVRRRVDRLDLIEVLKTRE